MNTLKNNVKLLNDKISKTDKAAADMYSKFKPLFNKFKTYVEKLVTQISDLKDAGFKL